MWSISADYVILDLDGKQFRLSGCGSNYFILSTDSDLFAPITSIDLCIPPPQSIQIKPDLSKLSAINLLLNSFGTFDLLHIDPPWSYLSDAPTRGVSVSYSTLSDKDVLSIHMGKLVKHGVVLLWTVNAKLDLSKQWLQQQGFKFRNLITWVKTKKHDKLAVGNGQILRHATEKCILATKGNPPELLLGRANDVILSRRLTQSQKPVEIYELAETLLPGKQYLDLFSRSCNLLYRWFSVGIELITNYRKSFVGSDHNESRCFMIRGNMSLPTIQKGKLKVVDIREGEVFLLPKHIPHSPQRPEFNSLGLVCERKRLEHEKDCLRWYKDFTQCNEILWEKYFYCDDLGRDLVPVVQEYKKFEAGESKEPVVVADEERPFQQDIVSSVSDPFSLKGFLKDKTMEISSGKVLSLFGETHPAIDARVLVFGGENKHIIELNNKSETFVYQLTGQSNLDAGVLKEGDCCVLDCSHENLNLTVVCEKDAEVMVVQILF
eukprot:maker-scaffold_12-augustus-gene-11.31-mRNA-1 protein AED:0.15 eAED:0.15 QI:0/0/0.33/0.66/0/0.33/3/260/491